jgi:hypothetical protein
LPSDVEFAFDGAEDAALLTGDEHATRVSGVVAASIFAKIVFALFAPLAVDPPTMWLVGVARSSVYRPRQTKRRLKATNQLPKLIAGVQIPLGDRDAKSCVKLDLDSSPRRHQGQS